MADYLAVMLVVDLVVFLLVFLFHVFRLVFGFEVKFGSWNAPLWVSVIGALVSLALILLNYLVL